MFGKQIPFNRQDLSSQKPEMNKVTHINRNSATNKVFGSDQRSYFNAYNSIWLSG
jgi:hypothetical protein